MRLPTLATLCTVLFASILSAADDVAPDKFFVPIPALHQRVTFEGKLGVPLPKAKAFVLFEPYGEMMWASDWHPIFTTPADVPAREGSIFTITRVTPAGENVTSVWTILAHDPKKGVIEYLSVYPGERIARIRIACEADGRKATQVTVRYTFTGLSDSGDRGIEHVTKESFAAQMKSWEEMILDHLASGVQASR